VLAAGGALVALLAVRFSAAQSPPTAADLETARALYKEGKELRAAGHLREALEKLRAAHTLGRTPITGVELARTYVMLGELVEARDVALDVARIPLASDETERSADARRDAAALADDLRARIPSIEVHADEGAAIIVDGERVPDAARGEPRRVNPGTHTVVERAADGREAQATVTVGERESRVVTLSFGPPAAGPQPLADARGSEPGARGVATGATSFPAPSVSEGPGPPGPDGFIFGAGFTLSPHVYLTATDDPPAYKTVLEVMAGGGVEIGAALTPRFEIFGRAFVALGDRGKPSYALGVGPAFSYRLLPILWLGGGVGGGRADTKFEGLPYSTDWVLYAQLEASLAVIENAHGQWLVSVQPGYYFANQKSDNPDVFANVSFGYRSF
jgi:hypothetical protein